MEKNQPMLQQFYESLDPQAQTSLDESVNSIVATKERGGKVMIVTGSGPNIHEGVTTLIAELIRVGIVDGVTTSSAVVAHEMAGSLDRVKRVPAEDLGMDAESPFLPRGGVFEFSVLNDGQLASIRDEMILDEDLMDKGRVVEAPVIIKAAGNMAYPLGLRTENLSAEALMHARAAGKPLEEIVGAGADARTMIGIGARKDVPVLVTVPQLVGGGAVGLSIADSIPVSERCMRIADMIDSSDIIIESAVALTQEIHDGPFECHTGHGIWAHWNGYRTCSLKGKTLIRIDLDENLRRAKEAQTQSQSIQQAIDKGLPKTKLTGIPFRMEMSAFARLEGSIPLVGDIGSIWPVMAWKAAGRLGLELEFLSYPQQSEAGTKMRDWIVDSVQPVDREQMRAAARQRELRRSI